MHKDNRSVWVQALLFIHIVSLVLNKTGFPMPKQGMLPGELDTLSGSDK